MKHCQICGNFPVIKSGFCLKHHRIYFRKVKEFRKNFIKYMKIKENIN